MMHGFFWSMWWRRVLWFVCSNSFSPLWQLYNFFGWPIELPLRSSNQFLVLLFMYLHYQKRVSLSNFFVHIFLIRFQFQWCCVLNILFSSFTNFRKNSSKIVLRLYWDYTEILLRFYRDSTEILLRFYWDSTEIL